MSYGPAEMEKAGKFAREKIVELANEILIWRTLDYCMMVLVERYVS